MMTAISLWQPWASLLVLGEKRFETRGFYTHYRGKLLIHAAKNASAKAIVLTEPFQSVLTAHGIACWQDLPRGAIIGEATLIGCCQASRVLDHLSDTEKAFSDFSSGRYAWEMQNPECFANPMPYRGLQGFFQVEGFDPIPG